MVAKDGSKMINDPYLINTDIANNDRVINAVVTFQKGDKVEKLDLPLNSMKG